jgi:4-hydroxybenzoate polyprenyltransferase
MLSIFKLIRFPNLLLIAFTLVTMRYGVMQPILIANGLNLELSSVYFALLVASVVLIAASGYMINDYFDLETDTINRPDKVLIGKVFTPNAVYNAYIVLNVLALILAFYVSYNLRLYKIFFIFPLTCGFLWFYSNTYKSQFLIGNILVSAFTALVPVIPVIYELPSVYTKYKKFIVLEDLNLKSIYIVIAIFSLFAFIINLIREIVKDMEDYEGDKTAGCRTVPIVLGLKASKIIVSIMHVFVIITIAGIYKYFLLYNEIGKIDFMTMAYFTLFLSIPLAISGYFIISAKERKNYSKASAFLKFVLLFGIIYAWIL